jgi:Lrp/AsnC family transcriptional regulator for asnA, asnC and gidA
MTTVELDELDHKIIALLRGDGRLANTEIGRYLGVSEATVRNRIRRLIAADIIEIAANVNLTALGYERDVYIGFYCFPGKVMDVIQQLVALQEIRYVAYVTGRYDILAVASIKTQDELVNFLTDTLGKIQGYQRFEIMHLLQVPKRDYYHKSVSPIGSSKSTPSK